jgi:lipopolysaccharide transport system ATP-binding protein
MSSDAPVSAAATQAASVVEVQGLGKCYHIYGSPRARIKQLVSPITGKNYYRPFWALRNISFEVKPGQTVGIMGANGSGKSTLLQLIAGILTPTEGKLSVRGRVAALLELGAGFNPEFTGRENVYMNAAILGFSAKEIEDRFEAIVKFADIGEFIDRPVKTYSSGMFVRLAFSVAVNVEPEVLIVDEALAVGDIKFQARCFRKFEEFQSSGKTILFVSHSTEHIVRHCSHAILLHQGGMLAQGEPRDISNRYMDLIFGAQGGSEQATPRSEPEKVNSNEPVVSTMSHGPDALETLLNPETPPLFENRSGYNHLEYRWGDGSVSILDYLMQTSLGYDINRGDSGDTIHLYVKVRFDRDIPKPIFGLYIKSPDGVTIFGTNSRQWDGKFSYDPATEGETRIVHFQFQALLNSGNYLLSLGVAAEVEGDVVPLDRRYDSIVLHIKSPGHSYGIVTLPAEVSYLKGS